ncbi:HAD-IA family hydrolase [Roseibium sp. MMSF_3412]|uniref:HAD-IA family hydrolase n=1 Tax=Roseibium sp. MMSF_3412 TaxID=3046712 RepID=UPI00273FFF8A|nr:HAD-IA family hydrolase [Roseibium sp. MMSF_3412]
MSETCVIFDLDGTLVDSEILCNQAFVDLLPELGETAEQLVHRYRGIKLDLTLADLEKRLGRRLPATFETTYRERVAELFSERLQPVPGAAAMLKSLGRPKCIASSGPPQKIAHSLKVSGLASHFGLNIYSSYVVGIWKPDPGLFLHAARDMGHAPENCIVVEDSDVGVQAAHAAGMAVLRYDPHVTAMPDDRATVFSDMSQLKELIERLEAERAD